MINDYGRFDARLSPPCAPGKDDDYDDYCDMYDGFLIHARFFASRPDRVEHATQNAANFIYEADRWRKLVKLIDALSWCNYVHVRGGRTRTIVSYDDAHFRDETGRAMISYNDVHDEKGKVTTRNTTIGWTGPRVDSANASVTADTVNYNPWTQQLINAPQDAVQELDMPGYCNHDFSGITRVCMTLSKDPRTAQQYADQLWATVWQ